MKISLCDVSEIATKAPCEAALTVARHVRIEIAIALCALLSLHTLSIAVFKTAVSIFKDIKMYFARTFKDIKM